MKRNNIKEKGKNIRQQIKNCCLKTCFIQQGRFAKRSYCHTIAHDINERAAPNDGAAR